MGIGAGQQNGVVESVRAKRGDGGVKSHIFAQIAPFYAILERIELASNSAKQMRPIAAAFDAPLPSPPLVCCRKQEAPAGRCWQDVLLLFLPSAAATGCCCDVACFLFRSYSPPSALLLAHLLAFPSLSCVFFLVGARSRRSPAA